ncbi:hypothetical protein [Reinekea sp.]|jgi:hypothetical protein|uniref:hypothetical protein n=1 Tax=Reinekea sp. TaxID=1970455 RepID=UPI00398A3A51
MRVSKLLCWSIIVLAILCLALYFAVVEGGLDINLAYASIAILTIGLVGVALMQGGYSKFGFLLVFFGNLLFLPLGLLPILLARKVLEEDIRSEIFKTYAD